jgi:hypothetical protein
MFTKNEFSAYNKYMGSEENNIYKLITLNPFSNEIIEVFKKISSTEEHSTYNQLRESAVIQVGKFVDKNKTNPLKEKTLFIFLFYIYSNYVEKFNIFIEKQKKTTSTLKLDFYKEIEDDFKKFNIPPADYAHHIAMFYQLRRAFYFIDSFLKGNSDSIKLVKQEIWNCIFTSTLELYNDQLWNKMEDFSLLITGPTGTGKSIIAKIIGYSSYIKFNTHTQCFETSFLNMFRSINLTEYSSSLLESELFGHEKGAFTDAINEKEGIFENTTPAHCIFLDEIGETPLFTQIKLLRVLQDRSFYKVGSITPVTFKGRIIGATNKSLNELTDPKVFRQDFFFRLSSNVIKLPSLQAQLQENPADISDFITHITMYVLKSPSSQLIKSITTQITKSLANYTWPGNVRELEQAIRRIILTKSYNPHNYIKNPLLKEITAQEHLSKYIKQLYDKHKSYSKVAKILNIDNRTVKKYIFE